MSDSATGTPTAQPSTSGGRESVSPVPPLPEAPLPQLIGEKPFEPGDSPSVSQNSVSFICVSFLAGVGLCCWALGTAVGLKRHYDDHSAIRLMILLPLGCSLVFFSAREFIRSLHRWKEDIAHDVGARMASGSPQKEDAGE